MSESRAARVERTIWRDGHFVAWRDATVHVLAQSLQRGSLAFDYLSVYETARGPAAFRLRDHVERLATTCRIVGLPLDCPVETLVDAAAETVRRNPGAKSVKISALIPSVEVELVPQDERVSVFIAAYDSGPDIIAHNPGEYRRRDVLSLKVEREKSARREDILPPHAKVAGNYTAAMTAKWRARREGFDDVVLLDENGFVTEGPTANLFLVDADGQLATPPGNKVLLGITRDSIMELAGASDLHCTERDVTPDELNGAAEVFLTGTSVGVWPVVRVDGGAVAGGDVGPMTARLRDRYGAVVRGEDPNFEHWLHYI